MGIRRIIILTLFGLLLFPIMLWAQDDEYYRLKNIGGDTLRIVPMDRPDGTYTGYIRERTDLNGDGSEDYIIFEPDSCSGWSECVYIIFVWEDEDIYRRVWGDYCYKWQMLDNEFTVSGSQNWKKIRLYERGEPQGLSPDEIPLKLLEYRNARYVEVPAGTGNKMNGPGPPGMAIPDVFRVYATLDTDKITYEIGRMEPVEFYIGCRENTCYYARHGSEPEFFTDNYTKAPFVLREKNGKMHYDYPLPHYRDMEFVNLQVIDDKVVRFEDVSGQVWEWNIHTLEWE